MVGPVLIFTEPLREVYIGKEFFGDPFPGPSSYKATFISSFETLLSVEQFPPIPDICAL